MAWHRTIESPIETLDDLTRVDHSTYAATSGVPIEVLVALSNEAGTDLWLTIPTKANDEVVDYYAEYVRDNLDPNLKVTVEYGNELWNNGYQDTHDLRAEAVEVWGVSPEDQPAHSAYIAYKATLVAQRFNAAFDKVEDGDKPLLHHTLGSQAARPAITEYLLESEAWQINDPDSYVPVNETFDSIAIATYFGGHTITNTSEREKLIEAINDPEVDAFEYLYNKLIDPTYTSSVPQLADFLQTQRDLADQYGLQITDYEGGAHLLHFDNTSLPQLRIDTNRLGRNGYGTNVNDFGWKRAQLNLAPFQGTDITFQLSTRHSASDNGYRTWMKVDDVVWSLQLATLGEAEAFGANVVSPADTSGGGAPTELGFGQTLALSAAVDADPTTVVADVYDDLGNLVATGIPLFDDGTRGDLVAGDNVWTNDGSDAGSP